jgi:transposase-like protein
MGGTKLAHLHGPGHPWARRRVHELLKYQRLQIRSTNPIERVNGEIKRRTEVVGIFSNETAIVRLADAILLDWNDELALARPTA